MVAIQCHSQAMKYRNFNTYLIQSKGPSGVCVRYINAIRSEELNDTTPFTKRERMEEFAVGTGVCA